MALAGLIIGWIGIVGYVVVIVILVTTLGRPAGVADANGGTYPDPPPQTTTTPRVILALPSQFAMPSGFKVQPREPEDGNLAGVTYVAPSRLVVSAVVTDVSQDLTKRGWTVSSTPSSGNIDTLVIAGYGWKGILTIGSSGGTRGSYASALLTHCSDRC